MLALVCAFAALKMGQGFFRVWRLTTMLEREELLLEDAVHRLDSLQVEIDRLKNDMQYIEELARREFGMIREGEEVYQVLPPGDEAGRKNR